jgi:microcompartment protein CcmL/EutN
MKPCPAIAVLEFDDIPTGIAATDAMLKRAPIAFVRCGTITHGRYLTVIGGTTASVAESAEEGVRYAAGHLLDHVVLPDVHPRLYEGVAGSRQPRVTGSLAILESPTVSATVRAAEAALKGTPVELVEIRLADAGLAGKGVVVLEGTLHDVEAAVALAVARDEREGIPAPQGGGRLSYRVIPAPHDGTAAQTGHGTSFDSALTIQLEGESL